MQLTTTGMTVCVYDYWTLDSVSDFGYLEKRDIKLKVIIIIIIIMLRGSFTRAVNSTDFPCLLSMSRRFLSNPPAPPP